MVMTVVVVSLNVSAPLSPSAPEDRASDRDDEQPRGDGEPRIEALGDDELREQERHDTQCEDAGRVCDRDDASEKDGMPGLSTRADEVAGHDRLPVARCKGVRCSPERSDKERDEDDAGAQLSTGDQRLEAPTRSVRHRAVLERRRDTRTRA